MQARNSLDPGLLRAVLGRQSILEDVLQLELELEGVGDLGHELAAARPPDDVEPAPVRTIH